MFAVLRDAEELLLYYKGNTPLNLCKLILYVDMNQKTYEVLMSSTPDSGAIKVKHFKFQ